MRHMINPSQLKTERKQRGWSQNKVAEALGVNLSTVRRWERGQAMPYPYYRKKLVALFDKTAQELGLLPDIQENDLAEDDDNVLEDSFFSATANYTCAQSDVLTTEQQDVKSIVTDNQSEWDAGLARHSFSHQSLWNGGLSHFNRVQTFQPDKPFSRHPVFIMIMILLSALLLVGVFPAFTQLPLFREKAKQAAPPHVAETYGPPSYALIIQNTDPSLNDTAQRLQNVFNAVYAQLVNRFAPDPASAAKHTVILTFSSDLASTAQISGTTITLNAHWIEQHPADIGLFTHELTLLVEQYPSSTPTWFSNGMADYARYVYGPADDNWSLPDSVQPHESYTQGNGVTARFLLWLELHIRLDIVDQLNHALQRGFPFSDTFHRLTHHTVNQLWNQYIQQPDITLNPQQLYTIATSGKPLYQSSFRLRWSPDFYTYAQGLYLSNFAIQANVTVASGSTDIGGGFFFRNNDTSWFDVFVFANGGYRVDYLYQPGSFTYNSAIKMGLNQTNRLTVIVRKSTIYIYINGQFVTQIDDNRLLSYGTLGVIVSKYTSPTLPDIHFDKVQVF